MISISLPETHMSKGVLEIIQKSFDTHNWNVVYDICSDPLFKKAFNLQSINSIKKDQINIYKCNDCDIYFLEWNKDAVIKNYETGQYYFDPWYFIDLQHKTLYEEYTYISCSEVLIKNIIE